MNAPLADGEESPLAIAPTNDVPDHKAITPAQAKIDAVSGLLAKAIERASDLRLTPEETLALKADFPDDAFRPGASGKENLLYIEHMHLRNRLDEVLGMGQAVLVPRLCWTENLTTYDNKPYCKVYIQAAFIVRGCYITEAVGDMDYYPHNASTNYGDAVEGAETSALRRCCKKFGIGLQAWSKTWCEGWWMRKGTQTPRPEGGKSNGDYPAQQPSNTPPCPKCGKTDSVIQGKAEFGGGLVCFKKKNGGCGHKWAGKDVRDGQDAPPAPNHASILDYWKKVLDPETCNLTILNSTVITEFKAIPGKHPERAKVWKLIEDFAGQFHCHFNHGQRVFVQQDPS